MKIAIVYESIYGNTAAVAQAVAEGLRDLGDVDVRAVSEESFEADMLVVGAPTHAHGLPSSMTRKAIEAAAEDAEARGPPSTISQPLGYASSLSAFLRSTERRRRASTHVSTSPGSSPGRLPRPWRAGWAGGATGSSPNRRASSSWTAKGLSKRASWIGPVDGERRLGPQLT